jgi:NAD(P)-dependent dehydrogenase (short-subunit alcohol dehydrogenase family)
VTGRRILISGASKGIGLATAERLSLNGHHPVGLARTPPSDFPGEFIQVDLSDPAAPLRRPPGHSRTARSTDSSTTSPQFARHT